MRALITGGAGFIGSHLAERLLGSGAQVRVFDNFSSGKRANLAHLGGDLEVVEGDVRDLPALEKAAAGCEVVFHEAAIVSVPYSVEHPLESHAVNIQGTLHALLAAQRAGARRLVFACSAAVYGEDPVVPKHEGMPPAPISPYGVEKITGEHYLRTFAKLYGVETVSLRYFNVFGPRQDPTSAYSGVISIFADRVRRGAPVTLFGDGGQTRDFVYVGNVVDANLLAATVPGVSGRAYNIGCGTATTLNQLLTAVAGIAGKTVTPSYAAPRAGDIRDSVADITLARRELGYQPRVGLEEGLRLLLASIG